jgi:hypothetical protein
MRPPSVYAKPSCPAADPCDLLRLLHGPTASPAAC